MTVADGAAATLGFGRAGQQHGPQTPRCQRAHDSDTLCVEDPLCMPESLPTRGLYY